MASALLSFKFAGRSAANVLLGAVTLCAAAWPSYARAQTKSSTKDDPQIKPRFLVSKIPDKPSVPPTISIPVEPLGFTQPGDLYLGLRYSFASLDFIDEDHLLFTFRIPGLLHRDSPSSQSSSERQIRAVVLKLPEGTVTAQEVWTLHDRQRYLWMLHDGHFLVRDRNGISEGDSSLKLKPLLDFPGDLLSLEVDPSQRYLVTNSRETAEKPPASTSDDADKVDSPATASADVTTDDDNGETGDRTPDIVVRILRRDTGQVMLVSRVRSPIHLPINTTGYIENLRGAGTNWTLNFGYFNGGSKLLSRIDSACQPDNHFLDENTILSVGCITTGESTLLALTMDGKKLWQSQAPATAVWPKIVVAPNGSRIAWQTLDLDHVVTTFAPIAPEQVKAQQVTVFDAATGDIALVAPLSPVLDSGGNVAISPSARRVALIASGAVQVFDLPAPPSLPAPAH